MKVCINVLYFLATSDTFHILIVELIKDEDGFEEKTTFEFTLRVSSVTGPWNLIVGQLFLD